MASSILHPASGGAVEWAPRSDTLDPLAFDCGRVGPYRLGPEVRWGPFGPVHLACCRAFESVLEIEFLESEPLQPLGLSASARAPLVLEHLNHCVGLEHPHVACVLGAGMDSDIPYVLRVHCLGRSLAELQDELRPPADVAAGILYGVAEGLGFLAEAGPRPRSCALGGLRREGILLGWDGSVQLLGAGLAILGDSRSDADLRGLKALSRQLDPDLGGLLEDAPDFGEAARRLRRWRREACADRQGRLGAWMRRVDGDTCDDLRRFFKLPPLN